jgi:hypothetical protein
VRLLERDGAPDAASATRRSAPALQAGGPVHAIVCRACGSPITGASERTTINGSHEHRFMNPAGHLFHIGCFGAAPGCRLIGSPSSEYPWFSGHTWQIALCGRCGVHLGWRFQSADAGFFGLCLDRLREADHFNDSSPAA